MQEKNIGVYILEILEDKSSEHHRLMQKEVLYYLKNDYGVEISRNTLSAYLCELKQHDLIAGDRGIYRIRNFSNEDIRMIVDCLLCSKSISQKKLHEIIEKLKQECEPEVRKKLNRTCIYEDINRTDNENIHSIINTLEEAISLYKKVRIVSAAYDVKGEVKSGKTYIVDPYYIVNEKGRLYLICNAGRGDVEPRRIDRIIEAHICKEKRMEITEISQYSNGNFNIAQYVNEHIYMYSGESRRIKIAVNTDRMGDFIDWFGKKYRVIETNGNTVVLQIKANINAVFFWALQYSSIAEVLEPQELRQMLREGGRKIEKMYE